MGRLFLIQNTCNQEALAYELASCLFHLFKLYFFAVVIRMLIN